ncbi:MAG: Rab family GTPase [Candidatus Heimdallarchaeaceae archaeon]
MGKDIQVKFRDYDLYKLAICGPGQTGKTSICRKLTENSFSPTYKPTVGADFFSYDYHTRRGKNVSLFYDFAGQDRFKDVRKVLYPGTDAAAIVFDVSKRESFRAVARYIKEIKSHLRDIEITLVGNKIDVNKREITREDAQRIAAQLGCNYVETSAATGEGIADFFKILVRSAMVSKRKKLVGS